MSHIKCKIRLFELKSFFLSGNAIAFVSKQKAHCETEKWMFFSKEIFCGNLIFRVVQPFVYNVLQLWSMKKTTDRTQKNM